MALRVEEIIEGNSMLNGVIGKENEVALSINFDISLMNLQLENNQCMCSSTEPNLEDDVFVKGFKQIFHL